MTPEPSVAYLFYSSSLGYFENIPVQALDEGRDSLQPLCLEIFSNGFLFDEMHFVWQAGTLTRLLLLAVVIASADLAVPSRLLLIRREYGPVSCFHERRWPMLCRQINGASMVMSSAMPPKPQNAA
jgi:hypothetical protein